MVSTSTSSLRFKPASLSTHHISGGMPLQPLCNAYHAPVFENVYGVPALTIDDGRMIMP
jgi:hypothetical protein